MSHPHTHDVIRSLDLVNQILSDVAQQHGGGDCGGDCANCPCSGEAPKPTKKSSDQDRSDPCDKC